MTINLAEGVVTARLSACEHAVEAFEGVNFFREGRRHNIVHREASLFQHSRKSPAHADYTAGPILGVTIRVSAFVIIIVHILDS